MKKYQIAALMVTMAVFTGCDDEGEATPPDGGGVDAASQDAAQAGGGSGGVVKSDARLSDAEDPPAGPDSGWSDAGGDVDSGGGDVDSGSALEFSTSLAGTKVVAELNDAETAQLCTDTKRFKTDLHNARYYHVSLCRVLAAIFGQTKTSTDAELRTRCEAGFTACVAEQDAKAPDQRCNVAPPACNITLAELLKCRTDQVTAMKALADTLPECSKSERRHFGNIDGVESLKPASCKAAEDRCPGIFSAGDDEEDETAR